MFLQRNRSLAYLLGLPLAAGLIIIGILGVTSINELTKKALETQLAQRAFIATNGLQFAIESSSTMGTIQRHIASMGAEAEFESIRLISSNNREIIASKKLSEVNTNAIEHDDYSPQEINHLAHMDELQETTIIWQLDHPTPHISVLQPVNITSLLNNNRPLGHGILLIRIKADSYQKSVNSLSISLAALVFSMLLFIAILYFLMLRKYILNPLQKIIEILNKRRLGENLFCETSGNNEITRLSEKFNELFEHNDSIQKMKDEFISTISHELRTPLTAIKGAIGVILNQPEKTNSEVEHKLLAIAYRNTDQLTVLINDLLDLGKMASGKMVYHFEQLDLVNSIKQAIEQNITYSIEKNIVIHFNHDDINQAFIHADEKRLQQVFSNLLSNAIKFSFNNTPISISLTVENNHWRVGVLNQGNEIPENFKGRIFQRFSQADSSSTRAKGGTGLGLNITKMIIDAHQGSIDFTSTKDTGTEFFFYLPIAEPL